MNRSGICTTAWICGLLAIAACRTSSATEEKSPPSPAGGTTEQISIYVGRDAPALEQYAARELQRYLYQLSGSLPNVRAGVTAVDEPGFIIGRRKTNPLVEQLAAAGRVKVSDADPGPQGYVLKRLAVGDKEVSVIAGSDAVGCLYGVYGLLEEHYGVGFYSAATCCRTARRRCRFRRGRAEGGRRRPFADSFPGPISRSRPPSTRGKTGGSSSTRWPRCG